MHVPAVVAFTDGVLLSIPSLKLLMQVLTYLFLALPRFAGPF